VTAQKIKQIMEIHFRRDAGIYFIRHGI
jgi:hypothetical protein